MYNSVFIVLYFNYNKPLNKTSQCVRNFGTALFAELNPNYA